MTLRNALEAAREQGLDLVEVAATSTPPVCRLLDFGRYRYEQARKEKEAKRGQKTVEIREIRLRPQVDDHDLDVKVRAMGKMLDEGDKIKVSVIFRGRELAHTENGWKLLKRLVEILKEKVAIDKPPAMEGKRMIMILSPSKRAKQAAAQSVAVTSGSADAKD